MSAEHACVFSCLADFSSSLTNASVCGGAACMHRICCVVCVSTIVQINSITCIICLVTMIVVIKQLHTPNAKFIIYLVCKFIGLCVIMCALHTNFFLSILYLCDAAMKIVVLLWWWWMWCVSKVQVVSMYIKVYAIREYLKSSLRRWWWQCVCMCVQYTNK